MNYKRHFVVIGVAMVLGTSTVSAGEIYRYTDADGNIHYGDRPSGDPSEKRLSIASSRTNNSAVQSRVQARTDAVAAKKEAAAERVAPPTKAEKRAARQEHEDNCQASRDRLESMITSQRMYREDENGERVYLDNSQLDEARDKAQELVEKNCG